MRNRFSLLLISPFIFAILSTSSCGLLANYVPKQIIIESDSFTLAWDPPELIGSTGSEAQKYNVYYRTHNTPDWQFLVSLEATGQPELLVNENLLEFGIYDFAVSYVDSGNTESELHSSLDSSAYPPAGWFVNWIGPQ